MTQGKTQQDHGGNLDAAIAQYGGTPADWIDLSTGINPDPYPIGPISAAAWERLPTRSALNDLTRAAARCYNTEAEIIPFAGAQGAIQALPGCLPQAEARILNPTYNEHAAAFRAAGWTVTPVRKIGALEAADVAIIVNPNNPDGRRTRPQTLLALAKTVGHLIVDESFVDTEPGLSLAPHLGGAAPNITVLRSFGKFYGLAGLRLGFALGRGPVSDRLRDQAGPWPISGPAIEIATEALSDTDWQVHTRHTLRERAATLDAAAQASGLAIVGGTDLFRTYQVENAERLQERLAKHHIWTRIFPYRDDWIRLGLPKATELSRLASALIFLA